MHALDAGDTITVEQFEENAAAHARLAASSDSMLAHRTKVSAGCMRIVTGSGRKEIGPARFKVVAQVDRHGEGLEFFYLAGRLQPETLLSRVEFIAELARRGGKVARD